MIFNRSSSLRPRLLSSSSIEPKSAAVQPVKPSSLQPIFSLIAQPNSVAIWPTSSLVLKSKKQVQAHQPSPGISVGLQGF